MTPGGSGRTIKTVAPDGASATQYSYQGNSTTVTDPAGKLKASTVDAYGNAGPLHQLFACEHYLAERKRKHGMETTATYASSWAPASLAGPNHDSGATTYDSYGRPYQTTIPDSQISQVASPVLFVRLTRLKM